MEPAATVARSLMTTTPADDRHSYCSIGARAGPQAELASTGASGPGLRDSEYPDSEYPGYGTRKYIFPGREPSTNYFFSPTQFAFSPTLVTFSPSGDLWGLFFAKWGLFFASLYVRKSPAVLLNLGHPNQ